MAAEMPDRGVRFDNAQFVQHLTGKEWVGVDKDGRLYAVKGACQSLVFLCASKHFQQNIHQRIRESINDSLAEKKAEWERGAPIEGRKAFYDGLIDKLSTMHLLSEANQTLLIRDFYDQRYQVLRDGGAPPFVAESIITIEMSQDPSVPESLKRTIRPELTRSGVNGTYIVV